MQKEAKVLKLEKTPLPVLEHIRISKGKAVITDLQNYLTKNIEYSGPDKLCLLDDVDVNGYDGAKDKMPFDEYPIIPKFKAKGSIPLTEQDLKNLYVAIGFVSNDELRPVMTGVLLSDEMCATNAHYLFNRKIEGWNPKKKNFPEIIINTDCIKILKLQKVKSCEVEYDKDMGFARIKGEGFEIISQTIEGKYPNYKAAVPNEFPNKITMNKAILIKHLTALKPVANKHTLQVVMRFVGKDSLIIRSEDIDRAVEGSRTIDTVSEISEMSNIAFNISLLLKVLKGTKEKEVVMKYSTSNRVALFNNILLMPAL